MQTDSNSPVHTRTTDSTFLVILKIYWIAFRNIFSPQCDAFQARFTKTNESGSRVEGEKVLYKRQSLPDNYVGPDFLSNLQNNMYVRKYNLKTLMVDAGCVYQQWCCIGVFWAIYFYLLLDWINPFVAFNILSGTMIVGYILFWLVRFKTVPNCISKTVREIQTLLVIIVFTLLLSPILHSLMATVSTDSIYAMTITFLLVNWVCLEYSTPSEEYSYEPGSPNTTAFSASLLGALCLASRLATVWHTFSLLMCATALFAFWPSLAHTIRAQFGRKGQLSLTIFLCLTLHAFVIPIAWYEAEFGYKCLMVIASLVGLVSLNILGPMLLIRMQRIKRTIHGPWDEAVVHCD